MGPPTDPLTSQMWRTPPRSDCLSPRLIMSSDNCGLLWRLLPVPDANTVPLNLFEPSLGTKFTYTPFAGASPAPLPSSTETSWALAGLGTNTRPLQSLVSNPSSTVLLSPVRLP